MYTFCSAWVLSVSVTIIFRDFNYEENLPPWDIIKSKSRYYNLSLSIRPAYSMRKYCPATRKQVVHGERLKIMARSCSNYLSPNIRNIIFDRWIHSRLCSIVSSFDFSKERIDIYQLINFTIKRRSFVRLSSPLAISDNELENGPETAEKPASQSFTFAVPPRYHLDSINFPSTLLIIVSRVKLSFLILFPLFSLSFHQTLLFHYN